MSTPARHHPSHSLLPPTSTHRAGTTTTTVGSPAAHRAPLAATGTDTTDLLLCVCLLVAAGVAALTAGLRRGH